MISNSSKTSLNVIIVTSGERTILPLLLSLRDLKETDILTVIYDGRENTKYIDLVISTINTNIPAKLKLIVENEFRGLWGMPTRNMHMKHLEGNYDDLSHIHPKLYPKE